MDTVGDRATTFEVAFSSLNCYHERRSARQHVINGCVPDAVGCHGLGLSGSQSAALTVLIRTLNRLWSRIDLLDARVDAKLDCLDAKLDALPEDIPDDLIYLPQSLTRGHGGVRGRLHPDCRTLRAEVPGHHVQPGLLPVRAYLRQLNGHRGGDWPSSAPLRHPGIRRPPLPD